MPGRCMCFSTTQPVLRLQLSAATNIIRCNIECRQTTTISAATILHTDPTRSLWYSACFALLNCVTTEQMQTIIIYHNICNAKIKCCSGVIHLIHNSVYSSTLKAHFQSLASDPIGLDWKSFSWRFLKIQYFLSQTNHPPKLQQRSFPKPGKKKLCSTILQSNRYQIVNCCLE